MALKDLEFDLYSNGYYFKIEFKKREIETGNVRAISFHEAEGKLYAFYDVEDVEKGASNKWQVDTSPFGQRCKFLELYPEGKEDLVKRLKDAEISLQDLSVIFPDGADVAIEEIKKQFERETG